jgi:NAD-dependent DNA ligase
MRKTFLSSYTQLGSLSVVRSEFENLIKNHGGSVAKSVTKSCTHLVRWFRKIDSSNCL